MADITQALNDYWNAEKQVNVNRIALIESVYDHLESVPEEEIESVASSIYWLDAMIAGAVRDAYKQIAGMQLMAPSIEIAVFCSSCNAVWTETVSSWSRRKEIERRRDNPKRERDQYLCEPCRDLIHAATQEQFSKHQAFYDSRRRELATMPYRDYLQSPEWQERRRRMLKSAGYRCQLCNASAQLHVHHRTYERRGSEYNGDLIVLCAGCHAKFHGKEARE